MSQGRSAAYWFPLLSKHARTLPSPLLATSHLSSPSGPAQGKVLGFTGVLGLYVLSVSSRVNYGYSACLRGTFILDILELGLQFLSPYQKF